VYTRFVRKYPEHAKTHFASIMILMGHLQTLTIIGSLQLGWPLIIQEILASINLPLMDYIPLPCILTDPVLKALLSYVETAVVLLLLMGAWLVVRCWREAWAEYYLSVLFSLLFTVGLRVSASLFMRYDEDQTRLIIARLVASLLPLFWLFLLWRFRRSRHPVIEATWFAARNDAVTGTLYALVMIAARMEPMSWPQMAVDSISAILCLQAGGRILRDLTRAPTPLDIEEEGKQA
jgi:hypothetical protein